MSVVLVVGASRGIGHEFARQYAADGARVFSTHRTPQHAQRLRALGARPIAQCRQCFRNITAALAEAGCTIDDVVRVRDYLTDAALFDALAPVFGEYLGRARPAATAIVCGLVDARMRIEIEVTAGVPQ